MIRSMLPIFLFGLFACSFAQTNSTTNSTSSSTGGTGVTPVFNSSSSSSSSAWNALTSLSSSSAGSNQTMSSTGANQTMSSTGSTQTNSTTGSNQYDWYPIRSQQIGFYITLDTNDISGALVDHLREDIATNFARELQSNHNVTWRDIYSYINVFIGAPVFNTDLDVMRFVSHTDAIIMSNVTKLLNDTSARDLADIFANLAIVGGVQTTETLAGEVQIPPQPVNITQVGTLPINGGGSNESSTGFYEGDPEAGNGASSATSATLFIGAIVAVLALLL